MPERSEWIKLTKMSGDEASELHKGFRITELMFERRVMTQKGSATSIHQILLLSV